MKWRFLLSALFIFPVIILFAHHGPGLQKERLFILSIGISNYNGPYTFENCDNDAILFTQVMKSSWGNSDTASVKTWLLLNNAATKNAILKAINEIIAQSKDDDVFAFFFAGFTN